MYETVSDTEKLVEKELPALEGAFGLRRAGETEGRVAKHLVKNFTCTECGKTLGVAVAHNLIVKGRCGKTGGLVNVNVSEGYKLTRG